MVALTGGKETARTLPLGESAALFYPLGGGRGREGTSFNGGLPKESSFHERREKRPLSLISPQDEEKKGKTRAFTFSE